MEYDISRDGRAVTVALKGTLNFAANEAFAGLLRDLDAGDGAKVTFDLSGLNHIDSVGLGMLYIAHDELGKINSSMCLARPKAGVKRLLELTEAEETFDILN